MPYQPTSAAHSVATSSAQTAVGDLYEVTEQDHRGQQAVAALVDAVSVVVNGALEQLLAHGVRTPALPLQLAELRGVLAVFCENRYALRHLDNIASITLAVRNIEACDRPPRDEQEDLFGDRGVRLGISRGIA